VRPLFASGGGADNPVPELVLRGASQVSIVQYSTFTEPGFDAQDARQGNLTHAVEVVGTVDPATCTACAFACLVLSSTNDLSCAVV